MRTLTLDVAGLNEALTAFSAAWKTGRPDDGTRISFASADLLWKVLTAKRWALLRAMTGREPVSVRRAARLAGRDVKAVHGDIQALLSAGLLRRTVEGHVEFPYDRIHVDFVLQAA